MLIFIIDKFWFARNLQKLLCYSKKVNVIEKAKEACKTSGNYILDHFPEVKKTICLKEQKSIFISNINTIILVYYPDNINNFRWI